MEKSGEAGEDHRLELMTTVVCVTPWRYIGNAESTRLETLLNAVPFSEIAHRVKHEMVILCCHTQNCDDNPGFSRVIYCAEIGQTLFDLFFNSASGYRGAYFESPQKGVAANKLLLGVVLKKLLSWSDEQRWCKNSGFFSLSLSAPSAKVWVAETTLALCESCSGEWSGSYNSDLEIENGRWELENHTHAKWGRQAPKFQKLKIFGGFVNESGEDYVAEHKRFRASEISRFGWS